MFFYISKIQQFSKNEKGENINFFEKTKIHKDYLDK